MATKSSNEPVVATASRAVIRPIEAGCIAECPHCDERVKFRARHRDDQVICNVYEDEKWVRVEQYHAACYDDAGRPHGKPHKSEIKRRAKKPVKQ